MRPSERNANESNRTQPIINGVSGSVVNVYFCRFAIRYCGIDEN